MSDDFNWDEWSSKRVNRERAKHEAKHAFANSLVPFIVFIIAVLIVAVAW